MSSGAVPSDLYDYIEQMDREDEETEENVSIPQYISVYLSIFIMFIETGFIF